MSAFTVQTPRLIPTAIVAALCALMAALGFWQLDRGRQKQVLMTAFDANAMGPMRVRLAGLDARRVDRYQAVTGSGEFFPGPVVYLDNRVRGGVPGFEVLRPLRIGGTQAVALVNLGWAAQGAGGRHDIPRLAVPTGEVAIAGLVDKPQQGAFRLGPDDPPLDDLHWIVQTLEFADLEDRMGMTLLPLSILLTPDAPFGGVREWSPRFATSPAKHRAYAFQWFSMSLVLLALFVATHVVKRRRRGSEG